MAAYTVEVAPAANRQIRKLDRETQKRLLSVIETLQEQPRPREATKLQGGEGLYRVRSGDYRIIYLIEDRKLLVLVVKVGHRREVYKQR